MAIIRCISTCTINKTTVLRFIVVRLIDLRMINRIIPVSPICNLWNGQYNIIVGKVEHDS